MTNFRKIAVLILCTMMILSMTACGEKDTGANDLPGAPEHYDLAVRVNINPEFILYVANGQVIAYEALNDDAQQVDARASIQDRSVYSAIEDIVRFSYEDGFLKDGGDINVTVVSAFSTEEEANRILNEAESSITNTSHDCGIEVNTVVAISEDVNFAPEGDTAPQGNDDGAGDEQGGQERDKNEGCPVCWGSGVCDRCDGSGTEECEECHGSGYEECSKCHGENSSCDECGGTGKTPHMNCNGTGIVNCRGCEGTGICQVCNGTGLNPNN